MSPEPAATEPQTPEQAQLSQLLQAARVDGPDPLGGLSVLLDWLLERDDPLGAALHAAMADETLAPLGVRGQLPCFAYRPLLMRGETPGTPRDANFLLLPLALTGGAFRFGADGREGELGAAFLVAERPLTAERIARLTGAQGRAHPRWRALQICEWLDLRLVDAVEWEVARQAGAFEPRPADREWLASALPFAQVGVAPRPRVRASGRPEARIRPALPVQPATHRAAELDDFARAVCQAFARVYPHRSQILPGARITSLNGDRREPLPANRHELNRVLGQLLGRRVGLGGEVPRDGTVGDWIAHFRKQLT